MFDYENLRAWDLGDAAEGITLTIEKVGPGVIQTQDEGAKHMPFIWFKGYAKPLGANKTNCATIAGMYGANASKWVGKRITIYTTTTRNKAGAIVDCIRVKPGVPADDVEEADLLSKRPDEPSRKKAVA
jgi:hypothetical protein